MDDKSTLRLLRRARASDRIFSRNLVQSALTPQQYFVLRAVAASEGLSQTAIMDATGIDRSSTAEVVRRLVSKGMLRRRRIKHDARPVRCRAYGMWSRCTLADGIEYVRAGVAAGLEAAPSTRRRRLG